MPDTTLTLHQAADEAARQGDYWTALRHAADILTAEPHDHRARLKLALSLAALGQPEAATRTLVVGARDLVRRGFLLSALGLARDALELSAGAPEVLQVLEKLHASGSGSPVAEKPRMPPPVPPPIDAVERPHRDVGRDDLIRMAVELGTTEPPAAPAQDVRPLPLFQEISREAFLELVPQLRFAKLPAGEVVIREGEVGEGLFAVIRGEVEVEKDGRVLAQLGAGSFFGELSLFIQKPRIATVRTRMPTELFEIRKDHVEALAERFADFGRGLADFARRRLLANVVATSPIFEPLDLEQRRRLLEAFRAVPVDAGGTVIEEGQSPEGLYVVLEGQFEVTKSDDGERVMVAYLRPGEVFGEIGLLRDQEATASVTASERSLALFLPRKDFDAAVEENPQARAYLDQLSRERLEDLSKAETDEVLDADDLILL
jgi:CRP-like cAMP-binding protein